MITRGFSFGVSMVSVDTGFAARCRLAEELGYDVITIPGHLRLPGQPGMPAPFPAVVAAAAATERVHVGTLVLNVPFYNPALPARDIESTMLVTGDRCELGIGSSGSGRRRENHRGTLRLVSPAELDERVTFVRQRTAGREPECNILIQAVVRAENPRPALEKWKAEYSAEELLAAPQVLVRGTEQIDRTLMVRRERYGLTYYTVFDSAMR